MCPFPRPARLLEDFPAEPLATIPETMGAAIESDQAGGVPFLIHTYEHRAYALREDRPFTIGRDSACDIRVNEVSVSRRHAEIRMEDGQLMLFGVGATGMLINGFPLTAPHALQPGDLLMVGTMKFSFTTDRLPTGMAVARPVHRDRMVEDRRPTLTFPTQPGLPSPTVPPSHSYVMTLMIVTAAGFAAVIWMFLVQGQGR